jgi:feruloyl esterase
MSFAPLLPPASIAVLSAGVRAQCAGHDGGLPTDKFLNDPRVCTINWSLIQCAPGQNPVTCLSAAQIAAVKAIYAGPKNPVTSAQIYPGYEPGSEDDPGAWKSWITGPVGIGPFPTFGLGAFFGEGFFANFVFGVPVYNMMLFNFTTDVAAADTLAPTLNAADPNLAPFRAHGGKLIQYAGWADPAVSPRDGIGYYEQVRSTAGSSYADQQSFYRLFMAPGMCHCAGGPGANAFGNASTSPPAVMDADHDVLLALERWRETGVPPNTIIATKYIADNPAAGIDFQRPLCVYPLVSRYLGAPNDPKAASSYNCFGRFPIRPFPTRY